jgi:hypothetical protein
MLDKIQKKARGMENAGDLDFVGKKEDFMNQIYFKDMKPYDFFDRMPKGSASKGSGFEKMAQMKTVGSSFDGKIASSMNFGQSKEGLNKSYFGVKTATNNINNTKNKINMFMSGPQKTSDNRNLVQKQYNMFGAKTNIAHNRLAHYLPQSVKSGKPKVNSGNLKFGFGVSSRMLTPDKISKNFQFAEMGAGPDAGDRAMNKVRLFTSGVGNNSLATKDSNWTSKFGLGSGRMMGMQGLNAGMAGMNIGTHDNNWMSKFGLSANGRAGTGTNMPMPMEKFGLASGRNWTSELNVGAGHNWKNALVTDRFSRNAEGDSTEDDSEGILYGILKNNKKNTKSESDESGASEKPDSQKVKEAINEGTKATGFATGHVAETTVQAGKEIISDAKIAANQFVEGNMEGRIQAKMATGMRDTDASEEVRKEELKAVADREAVIANLQKAGTATGTFLKKGFNDLGAAAKQAYESSSMYEKNELNKLKGDAEKIYRRELIKDFTHTISDPAVNAEGKQKAYEELNKLNNPSAVNKSNTGKSSSNDKTSIAQMPDETPTQYADRMKTVSDTQKVMMEIKKKQLEIDEKVAEQRTTNKLLKPLVQGSSDMKMAFGVASAGGFNGMYDKAKLISQYGSRSNIAFATGDVNKTPFALKTGMLGGNLGGRWALAPGMAPGLTPGMMPPMNRYPQGGVGSGFMMMAGLNGKMPLSGGGLNSASMGGMSNVIPQSPMPMNSGFGVARGTPLTGQMSSVQSPMPIASGYSSMPAMPQAPVMPSREAIEQGDVAQGLQISPASGRAVTYIRGRYKKDKKQPQSSQQNV